MTTVLYSHEACAAHDPGDGHPEQPLRLKAVLSALEGAEFKGLDRREAPRAERAQLTLAHPADYVDQTLASVPQSGRARLDSDTIVSPGSGEAALRAAGAVCAAVDAVMAGEAANAFCAVRPPGHHAEVAQAMGFCLFNNVAIGALHAREAHSCNRVAVLDFDVHHGNGTEDILANDERVLMTSFFQHPFYPYTGADNQAKNMVNVPLPAGTKGDVVRQVVDEVWLPRLLAFRPQALFISAGFDAHREDDLGQMGLVEADYAYITRKLMDVADEHAEGRVVSSLEGGYNLSALARSVGAHVKTLAQL